MDRQRLKRALTSKSKGTAFIKVSEVAAALGIQPETAQANYLRQLEYIPSGRAKLYLIDDVVDSIAAAKKAGSSKNS